MKTPRYCSLHSLFPIVIVVVLSMVAVSCGTSNRGVTARKVTYTPATLPQKKKTDPVALPPQNYTITFDNLSQPAEKLVREAQSWLGTRYLYGGADRNGADCSGFIMSVYLNALGIKLPRNSAKQQEYCSMIDKRDIVAGDLIFFSSKSTSDVAHVGLYLGNGLMIHSSSSRGVVISPIDAEYYVTHYHSSGRVDPFHAMVMNSKATPSASKSTPVPVSYISLDELIDQKADSIFDSSFFE